MFNTINKSFFIAFSFFTFTNSIFAASGASQEELNDHFLNAAATGNCAMMVHCLNLGAQIGAVRSYSTAFDLALRYWRIDCIQELINRNCQFSLHDSKTPLEHFFHRQCTDMNLFNSLIEFLKRMRNKDCWEFFLNKSLFQFLLSKNNEINNKVFANILINHGATYIGIFDVLIHLDGKTFWEMLHVECFIDDFKRFIITCVDLDTLNDKRIIEKINLIDEKYYSKAKKELLDYIETVKKIRKDESVAAIKHLEKFLIPEITEIVAAYTKY